MKGRWRFVLFCLGILGTDRLLLQSPAAQGGAAIIGVLTATDGNPAELRVTSNEVIRREREGTLRLLSNVTDPFVAGRHHERLQQMHLGLPIIGADVTRQTSNGLVTSIYGELLNVPRMNTAVRLQVEDVNVRLAGYAARETPRRLQWLPLSKDDVRLVYESFVVDGLTPYVAYIDADTGEELKRIARLTTQSAVGEGLGVLGDRKKISTRQTGSGFLADDGLRPPLLQTVDLRGSESRLVQIAQGQAPNTGDLAIDSDNEWTDPSAVDAHVNTGLTYDFLWKRFGYRGLDNANSPMYSTINLYSNQQCGGFSNQDPRLNYCLNAGFITPGPGGWGLMFFGNGSSTIRGGVLYRPFAGALDVIAHELAHGVTNYSSDLQYENESGALNESFSDIIGTAVEAFYQPRGSGERQADYLAGEDIARSASGLDGFRSLADPRRFGDPDHYWDRVYIGATTDFDSGGVHTNSGIMNHAFYLAIEGGVHQTGGRVTGVGFSNREQIENAFFRAFVYMLTSRATFYQARVATIQSARELYGAGSAAERAITQAWNAVGVSRPGAALTTRFTPNPVPASPSACDGAQPSFPVEVAVSEFQNVGINVEGFNVYTFDALGREIGNSRFFGPTFATWFSSCGPGSTQIPGGGRACARVCMTLGGRSAGFSIFEFTGYDLNGAFGVFNSDVLRLGNSAAAAADDNAGFTAPTIRKAP